MATSASGDAIPLASLNPQQIQGYARQVESELEFLTSAMKTLKTAQEKFQESLDSIQLFAESQPGQESLIPLSGSVYVKANMKNTNSLLINIGTGFYIEKTPKGAGEYFTRRIDDLTREMENLKPSLQEKEMLHNALASALEGKMQEMAAMQQAVASKST